MLNWFKVLSILIKKDIKIEFQTKETLVTLCLFGLLIITVFSLSTENNSLINQNFGAGILWSSVIFAGSIAMVKFFYHEEQNKTLQSLLVMPVPSELILISSVLFNLNIFSLKLILGCIVFNIGYSVVGSFFGVISSKSSSKEILLTMLLIPIITPILMFIIATTNDVIRSELNSNFQILLCVGISFDIIFLTLMSYLFGKILED